MSGSSANCPRAPPARSSTAKCGRHKTFSRDRERPRPALPARATDAGAEAAPAPDVPRMAKIGPFALTEPDAGSGVGPAPASVGAPQWVLGVRRQRTAARAGSRLTSTTSGDTHGRHQRARLPVNSVSGFGDERVDQEPAGAVRVA